MLNRKKVGEIKSSLADSLRKEFDKKLVDLEAKLINENSKSESGFASEEAKSVVSPDELVKGKIYILLEDKL